MHLLTKWYFISYYAGIIFLATPVLLLLKAIPTKVARVLVKIFHSTLLRIVAHPIFLAVVNVGGLWLLYTTPLYDAMYHSEWLFLFIHVHVFITGVLFTFSIITNERYVPVTSLKMRALVLFFSVAAHSILGKFLYANPPMNVEVGDARVGSMFMYYSGDAVHLILIVMLGYEWYTERKRNTKLNAATPL